MIQSPDLVLVVGAEGAIGGKLFYDLLRAEFNIRCLVRFEDESKVDRKPGVEFFYCDSLEGDIPDAAFDGVKYVVNIVSPLNSGSMRSEDVEALERLNNVLITRSKSRGVSRYVVLSPVHVADESTSASPWPGICWHQEYSIVNSGVPYSIFRSGLLLGEQNAEAILQIAQSGGTFSLFGRRSSTVYVTPIELLTEAISRSLKTDQSSNRTYDVSMDKPVVRKELSRMIVSSAKLRKFSGWEAETQVELSSSRHGGDIHSVVELELQPHDYERTLQRA
jgi:uncharacterized protein YbjT (DUF2867 family)